MIGQELLEVQMKKILFTLVLDDTMSVACGNTIEYADEKVIFLAFFKKVSCIYF